MGDDRGQRARGGAADARPARPAGRRLSPRRPARAVRTSALRAWLARYDRFVDLCGQAPGYLVAGIAVAVFVEVAARNLGLGVLRGVLEAVEYALVAMTFLGATWLFRAQRHVRVEILVAILPERFRRGVEIAVRLVVLVVVLGMVWASGRAAALAWSDGSTIRRMLTVPEWLPVGVTAFGFLLLSVEAARQLIDGPAAPEPGQGGPGRDEAAPPAASERAR